MAALILCVGLNVVLFEWYFHHSLVPFEAAHQSAVRPRLSGLSGLTSSRSTSILTTPSCPLEAAYNSGVWPDLFSMSRLASSVRILFSPLPRAYSKHLTRALLGRAFPVCPGRRRSVRVVFSPLPDALSQPHIRAVFCCRYLVYWRRRRPALGAFSPFPQDHF